MKSLTTFILEKLHISNYNDKLNKQDFKLNRKDIDSTTNELFNSGEYSGFRKGINIKLIKPQNLKKQLRDYYGKNEVDEIPDKFYEIIQKNATNKVLCCLGTGYDGVWSVVVFMSTNPYSFIITKNGYKTSRLYNAKNEKETTKKILKFCEQSFY